MRDSGGSHDASLRIHQSPMDDRQASSAELTIWRLVDA
jgi:hypothetical protein